MTGLRFDDGVTCHPSPTQTPAHEPGRHAVPVPPGGRRRGWPADEAATNADGGEAPVAAPRARVIGAGRATAWLLLVTGFPGLVASFILTVERFKLATEPGYRPSCSLNPVISCGSVMTKPQAAVFGFPNPLLGIAGFAVVLALAFGLLAGARYRRWHWLGLHVGATLGLGLICWLISQSLYSIGALCPYCMVVWAVMFPLWWYLTLHNLKHRVIPIPRRRRGAVDTLLEVHWSGPLLWFLTIAALVLVRFWSYWQTLL